MGVLVDVGEGISVLVSVTGAMTVTPATTVSVKVGVMMIGVAVIMLGVREGITVQTGKGWGETPKESHAPRKNIRTGRMNIFFIR
jgi:hypothetical protein